MLQTPTVKLRGKSKPETQKQRKRSNFALAAFGTNIAVISFCPSPLICLLFCLSHQCSDGFKPQDKTWLFLLSKKIKIEKESPEGVLSR